MAADKTPAIVIRTVPFGETSCVVTLYTREFGKLRALAKGAWRPKSAFDGALDLLSICQVLVLRKVSGGLDLLTEAHLGSRFRVAGSLPAVYGGMYIAELLDALSADADPQPEMFDVAETTLAALSGHSGGEDAVHRLVIHAELTMLRLIGQAPTLVHCAECLASVAGHSRIAFGMLDGGALCAGCRQGRRAVVSVSADTIASMHLLSGPPAGWKDRVNFPAAIHGELRAVMNTYLSHLVGRRLTVSRWLSPASRTARPS
ncbi:MAG: DNA repair protein RecO [Planctomycetota bacterium]